MAVDGNYLLNLPPEIRWKILSYVQQDECSRAKWKIWNNKRLVCKQIKDDIDYELGMRLIWNSTSPEQQIYLGKLEPKVIRILVKCGYGWSSCQLYATDFFRTQMNTIKEICWELDDYNIDLLLLLTMTDSCSNLSKLDITFGKGYRIPGRKSMNILNEKVTLPKVKYLRISSVTVIKYSISQVALNFLEAMRLPKLESFYLKLITDNFNPDFISEAFKCLFYFFKDNSDRLKNAEFSIKMIPIYLDTPTRLNGKELLEIVEIVQQQRFLIHLSSHFQVPYNAIDQSSNAPIRTLVQSAVTKYVNQRTKNLKSLCVWDYLFSPGTVYFPNLRTLRLFNTTENLSYSCNLFTKSFPHLEELSLQSDGVILYLEDVEALQELASLRRATFANVFLTRDQWKVLTNVVLLLNLEKIIIYYLDSLYNDFMYLSPTGVKQHFEEELPKRYFDVVVYNTSKEHYDILFS